MKEKKSPTPPRKTSSRQVVAIIGVAILVLLYIVTLILAFTDSSESASWFRICLFATFAVPIVIWIYSWMYGRLTGKSAIGDPEAPRTPQGSLEDTASQTVSSDMDK